MGRQTEAIVFPEAGEVRVQEIPLAEAGPGDVLVEIEYSSVSVGTERHALTGRLREPGQPIMTPFPHVAGYQAAGVVIEAGREVEGIAPGDRVHSQGTRVTEDAKTCGVGAEIAAIVADEGLSYLDAPIKRVCVPDTPIPFAPAMEAHAIPDEDNIMDAVRAAME